MDTDAALAGPVPLEFANLRLLIRLILANKPDLAGPLPAGITALNRLEQFMAGIMPPVQRDTRRVVWRQRLLERFAESLRKSLCAKPA